MLSITVYGSEITSQWLIIKIIEHKKWICARKRKKFNTNLMKTPCLNTFTLLGKHPV